MATTSLLLAASPLAIRQPLLLFYLEVPLLLLRPPPPSPSGLRFRVPLALNPLRRLNQKSQSLIPSRNPPPLQRIPASPLVKINPQTVPAPPLQGPSTLVAAVVVVVVVALLHLPRQVSILEQLLLVIHSDNQLVNPLQAVPRLSNLPPSILVHLQALLSLLAVNQHPPLRAIPTYLKQQRLLHLEVRTPDLAHPHPVRLSALLLSSHPPPHLEAHYSL